jgi:hypothetical protein
LLWHGSACVGLAYVELAYVGLARHMRGDAVPKKRTRSQIEAVCDAIQRVVSAHYPMTVRQVFYQLVKLHLIEKTERDYNDVVVRLLTKLRLDGELPWQWIADSTRWMRKPTTYDDIEDALRETADSYRRALWRDHDVYVEVWLEKEALAGVLLAVTAQWDVPLMVTRGFASLSYLHSAAETIASVNKPTYLYYFGDYDPSGVEIDRNIERRLRQFLAPDDGSMTFERVAVTPEQIRAYDLPTRPTKRTSHGRGLHHGDSVEVDALDPDDLRRLVEDRIVRHVDPQRLRVHQAAEDSERELLGGLPAMLRRDAPREAASS